MLILLLKQTNSNEFETRNDELTQTVLFLFALIFWEPYFIISTAVSKTEPMLLKTPSVFFANL